MPSGPRAGIVAGMNRFTSSIIAAGILMGCVTHIQQPSGTATSAHRDNPVHGITQELAPDGMPRYVWCSDCPGLTPKRMAPVEDASPTAAIHFASNSADIGSTEIAVLQSVMDKIGRNSVTVILHGYTDAIGTLQDNQALAERRAEAVRAWMAAHADKQLTFQTSASGKCCYAQEPGPSPENRRVEIYIKRGEK